MLPNRQVKTPLQAWSWSALSNFETCPHQFHQVRILRNVREKKGEAMMYGLQVHKKLENRLKKGAQLPKDLEALEPRVRALENMGGELIAEQELALTENMTRTDWFGKDVWVRAKLDVVINLGKSMILVDWKTGKVKDDWGQLTMAAHAKFVLHPEVEKIGMIFVWTAHDDKSTKVVTREDAALMWSNQIVPRVERFQRAFDNGEFPPKPSGLCRKHCPVKSCKFHGVGLG